MSDKAAQYKQQQSEFEVPKFDAEGKPLSKNEQKERVISTIPGDTVKP